MNGNLSRALSIPEITTKPVKTTTVERSEGVSMIRDKRPTIETTGTNAPPSAMKTKVDIDQHMVMLRHTSHVGPTNSKALATSRATTWTKDADMLTTPKDHSIEKSSHFVHMDMLTTPKGHGIRRSKYTDPMVMLTVSKAFGTRRNNHTVPMDMLTTLKGFGIRRSSHADLMDTPTALKVLGTRRNNHTDTMDMLTALKCFSIKRSNYADPMDTPTAPKVFGTRRSSRIDTMDTLTTPKGFGTRRSGRTTPIDTRNVSKATAVTPNPTTRVVDTTTTGTRTVVAMNTRGVTGTMNPRGVVGAVNIHATVVGMRGVQTARIMGEDRGLMGTMNVVRTPLVSTGSTYRAGMKTTQGDEGITVTRNERYGHRDRGANY